MSITIEKRDHLVAQAKVIMAAAKAENRDVTAAEGARFDALMNEADTYTAPPVWKAGQETGERRELREGEVRFLKPEERIAAEHPNTEGLSFGRMVRGLATGNWKHADAERRAAMSEGTLSAGGYAVPTPVASEVIDLVRAKTVCIAAGARTVPMESSTLSLPRLTTDAPASWKAELAAASTGVQAFDRVLLTAKTLYALIPLSLELFEDSELGTEIEDATAKVIALGLDQAALFGSGTGATPQGIFGATGVQVQHAAVNGQTVSAAGGYDILSTAVDLCHAQNFEPNAVAMAPRTYGEFDRLKDNQLRYLAPPTSIQNLKMLSTSSIGIADTFGTANNASKFYMGDFSQMVIGMRHELTIEVLPAGYDGTYSGAQHGVVFIRAYIRADVGLRHPAAFVTMDGLL